MGVKRLKIKDDLNYRRGGTAHHCSDCNHFVADHKMTTRGVHPSLYGEEPRCRSLYGEEPRCRVIGLNPGRQYRINPNNICDRYDNSVMLKRLRGY